MLRRWVKVTVTRALPPTYLSSVHCRRRCWALGEWKENLSELRQFCFSGDSRLRSCSSSCSYMSLWRSNADRFSSSCCCSRLFSIDCMGSKQGFFFSCYVMFCLFFIFRSHVVTIQSLASLVLQGLLCFVLHLRLNFTCHISQSFRS